MRFRARPRGSTAHTHSVGRAGCQPCSNPRRDDGGHALSFHRRVFLDFSDLFERAQDFFHHPAAFVNMRELTAAEQDIHQDFVFVLKEFARA